MPRIYLVRHGKASAGWDADHDPGLDDLGRQQSRKAAESLAPIGPLSIVSSPLLRTRETSEPLAEMWRQRPRMEPRVAEIPSPTEDLSERSAWLPSVMADKWSNLGSDLQDWRTGVIEAIRSVTEDSVIFSHFIAINVIVGEAEGDDSVVVFYPDNCSITIVDTSEKGIAVVERGVEAGTRVN